MSFILEPLCMYLTDDPVYGFIQDNQGPMVTLLMPHIFKAMAESSIDVRLMAFKFFHLVVKHYPPTFSLYADKVLLNYYKKTSTFPVSALILLSIRARCSLNFSTY